MGTSDPLDCCSDDAPAICCNTWETRQLERRLFMFPSTASPSCHATVVFLCSRAAPFSTPFLAVCFKHVCHIPRKRLLEGSIDVPFTPLHNVSTVSFTRLPSEVINFFELHLTKQDITAACDSAPFIILGKSMLNDHKNVSAQRVHRLVSLLDECRSKGPRARYQDPAWLALVGFRSFQRVFGLEGEVPHDVSTTHPFPSRFLTTEVLMDGEEVDEVCDKFALEYDYVPVIEEQNLVLEGLLPTKEDKGYDDVILTPSDLNFEISFDSAVDYALPSSLGIGGLGHSGFDIATI